MIRDYVELPFGERRLFMDLSKKTRAPLTLQGEISLLMETGAIPQEDLLDLLDHFRPKNPLLPYWEQRYPGKGEALMRILRGCYSWDGTLQPLHSDVNGTLTKALFWVRDLPSPQLIQLNGSDDDVRELIQTPLHVHLREYLKDVEPVDFSPWEPIREIGVHRCVSEMRFRQYEGQLPCSIRELMWLGYDELVRYTCAYIIANEDGRHNASIDDLAYLLTILHRGCVLVGFTPKNSRTGLARPVVVAAAFKPRRHDGRDSVAEIAKRGCVD